MVNLLSLFYFLHLVSCVCCRLLAEIKVSIFTLIMIDLPAEDYFSFMRGKHGNSVLLSGCLPMQLFLVQYFQRFDCAILTQKN